MKNPPENPNCGCEQTQETIRKPEDRSIDNFQSEEQD